MTTLSLNLAINIDWWRQFFCLPRAHCVFCSSRTGRFSHVPASWPPFVWCVTVVPLSSLPFMSTVSVGVSDSCRVGNSRVRVLNATNYSRRLRPLCSTLNCFPFSTLNRGWRVRDGGELPAQLPAVKWRRWHPWTAQVSRAKDGESRDVPVTVPAWRYSQEHPRSFIYLRKLF